MDSNPSIKLVVKKLNKTYVKDVQYIHSQCLSNAFYSDESFLNFFQSSLYEVYGAFYCEKMVGFVVVMISENFAEIVSIAVLQSYRRLKIATILLNHILCNNNKILEIFLEVSFDNLNAINFYKNFGFDFIGVRKKYGIGVNGKISDFHTMKFHKCFT